MASKASRSQLQLELFLVAIAAALTCLLHKTVGYKIIVLNLFFLPVVLAGFYLGRYRAGVLTLFCVLSASLVMTQDLADFSNATSPIIIGLSITVWGGVLGLTSLLVGTLSDENAARMVELHEAHVGVIEVLSRYLQSANPKLRARSSRVAALSQRVAVQMRLLPKEIDDIRVAALLHDMENIEITAKVIRKAIGDLEIEHKGPEQHTFHGSELVQSLGSVLTGAFPLLLNQNETLQHTLQTQQEAEHPAQIPFGAQIIRTVRAYVAVCEMNGENRLNPLPSIDELRCDIQAPHHPAVLHALEVVLAQGDIETLSDQNVAHSVSRKLAV